MSKIKILKSFYSIVSATPSCVNVIDKNGLLIEMNPQGLALIEADSLEDVIGANVYDIVEESHREKFKKFNEKVCKGEKINLIFEIISLKGTRRWMETFATPYELDNGEIVHLSITNEITERINKEIELDKQIKMANHNVKLATIGEIFSGVGHEVNNPLSIICGQLAMIETQLEEYDEEELDRDMLLERISYCQKSAVRIANIVKGLRNFSRSDNDNVEKMNLSLILQESIDMIKEIYERKNIIIRSNIEKDVFIEGNIGRIQQIIMNLISNAKDAVLDSEKKRIDITLLKGSKDAHIILKDTGCGIPDNIKKKIFDPFFTTKGLDKGTGIGLALVNSFIAENNGKISVVSKENFGTRFRIKLPLTSGKKENNEKESKLNKIKKNEESIKVLVVDDEVELAELLQEQLEMLNCQVITSSNGEDALNILENNNDIGIVLSDMQMPKMSGLELLNKIKNNFKGKFYLMSGDNSLSYESYKDILDGILTKPFNLDKIEEILNGK